MPSGPEWIIVLVVVLVIFGGSQLPKLARNLGKAQKEFKDGLSEGEREALAQKEAAANARVDDVRREELRSDATRTELPRSDV